MFYCYSGQLCCLILYQTSWFNFMLANSDFALCQLEPGVQDDVLVVYRFIRICWFVTIWTTFPTCAWKSATSVRPVSCGLARRSYREKSFALKRWDITCLHYLEFMLSFWLARLRRRYRWSLFSHMVSVRLENKNTCTAKTKHSTTLNGAWWVTLKSFDLFPIESKVKIQ